MTTEELRVLLNISLNDAQYDDKIDALYALSKKVFTQYTRVELASASFTDTIIPFEGTVIYLNHTPFISMTSFNSYALFNGVATEITDYQEFTSVIHLNTSLDVKYIELQYTAGLTSIPTEIDSILGKLTSHFWKFDDNKVMLGSRGEAILEPDAMKIPKTIRDTLAIYRVGI